MIIEKGEDVFWVTDPARKAAFIEAGARQLSVIRNHPGSKVDIYVLHIPPEVMEAAEKSEGSSTEPDDLDEGDEP